MTHFVIIANGTFHTKEIIEEVIRGKTIIALDGAANKLRKLNIKPDVILGDFDSINDSLSFFQTKKVLIVPAKNQDFTDLQKGIQYCDTQNAESIHIICAHGRDEDHHQSNFRTLRKEYKKERPIYLHSETQTLRQAKDETITFDGCVGDKCGIVAAPAGSFTSTGLKYNGKNYELNYGHSESTSNELISDSATVTITGEALVIMPPIYSTHRELAELPEIEQLEKRLRDLKS